MKEPISKKRFEEQVNIIWGTYERSWGVSIKHTSLQKVSIDPKIVEFTDKSKLLREIHKMELEAVYARFALGYTPTFSVKVVIEPKKR